MYYTIKIETNTAGTETRDLRQFQTSEEALVRFHGDLAKYINNTSRILEMMISDSGNVLKKELWTAPEEVATVSEGVDE
jgi:hypothetical protein